MEDEYIGDIWSLFDEDAVAQSGSVGPHSSGTSKSVGARPPEPRGAVGLCGLDNLGTTCYLNSLLQSLFYTPLFRQALFSLTPEQLGVRAAKADRTRVIPLELQRLFARMMLADQDSVRTEQLTASFGWTRSDEVIQHDAQELNRVLFNAIEKSLVGTPGSDLINRLYGGSLVNLTQCLMCGYVSEREEQFLDLTIPVVGSANVQASLAAYTAMEELRGNNQYHCGGCDTLVDAQRGVRLRRLPPILTLGLNRFSYDWNKGIRIKESCRFEFPTELSLKEFCMEDIEQELDYVLYSVVIHRGSAGGGHYFAYIRDVYNEGTWRAPREAVQKQPEQPEVMGLQLDFSGPLELVVNVLRQHLAEPGDAMRISELCATLTKESGRSWNAAFKRQHGTIKRFLQLQAEYFVVQDDSVALTDRAFHHGIKPPPAANADQDDVPLGSRPVKGDVWFEFNDSIARSITEAALASQYQGKESAYMLFYVRRIELARSRSQPPELPAWLRAEVQEANVRLAQIRQEHDVALHRAEIKVYGPAAFIIENACLVPLDVASAMIQLTLDHRDPIDVLLEKCQAFLTTQAPSNLSAALTLHRLKSLSPGRFHLYEPIQLTAQAASAPKAGVTNARSWSLANAGVQHGDELYLWDGETVLGRHFQPGEETEPIFFHVDFLAADAAPRYFEVGVPQNAVLLTLAQHVAERVEVSLERLHFFRLARTAWGKSVATSPKTLPTADFRKTLKALQLQAGEHVMVELLPVAQEGQPAPAPSLVVNEFERLKRLVTLTLEHQCLPQMPAAGWPRVSVSFSLDKTLEDLKSHIIRHFEVASLPEGGGRLRVFFNPAEAITSSRVVRDETVSLEHFGVKTDSRVVLEPLQPLCLEKEILLRILLRVPTGPKLGDEGKVLAPPPADGITEKRKDLVLSLQRRCVEVVAHRHMTLNDLLTKVKMEAQVDGDEWHLCLTDQVLEEAAELNDFETRLDRIPLVHGETLLLEPGAILPKGYIHVHVYFQRPTLGGDISTGDDGVIAQLAASLDQLSLQTITHQTNEAAAVVQAAEAQSVAAEAEWNPFVDPGLVFGVDLLVSHGSSLEDLKKMILNQPVLLDLGLRPGQLRVREMTAGHAGRIIRAMQKDADLKRLRVHNNIHLAITVLREEPDPLPTSSLLLQLVRRDPVQRTTVPVREVVFDTAVAGATLEAFKDFLTAYVDIPPVHMKLAKHVRDRFKWRTLTSQPPPSRKKGTKKKKNRASDLLDEPAQLRDGDTIAVKDMRLDPKNEDDFTTSADLAGRLAQDEDIGAKREARQQKKGQDGRAEVGLTIKVGSFESHSEEEEGEDTMVEEGAQDQYQPGAGSVA